jgi:hypothetical protein
MKVRIYEDSAAGRSDVPLAIVSIAVPGEGTAAPPGPSGRAATYALEGVEAADPEFRDRVRAALTHGSMPVTRSRVSVRGAVRTRGEVRAEAPTGSPAYWRAALAFPFDRGLRSNPDDYASLLAAIDPPTPAAEAARAPATEPEPSPEADPGAWYVTLVTLLDRLAAAARRRGAVPTRGAIAVRGAVRTRGGGEPAAPIAPELIDPIVERLRSDPEFLQAVAQLGLALSLPEREKVLEWLEGSARKAQAHEERPD